MIRAQYTRALVLGLAGLIVAAVALVGVITLLTQSVTWSHLFTLSLVLVWSLSGLMFLVRSRPSMTVSTSGVRQLGIWGWQLAWNEVLAAEITPSKLVIEPTADALQRQSVRSAVQWSRIFASGQRARGAIVLPQPRLNEAARRTFRAHGVETDTGTDPKDR